jgi:hypothetical protein
MLFKETVAVNCENNMEHINMYNNSFRTSQETHYISATKTNRLMMFKEKVAVNCENNMEHINMYKNSFRTSQETHYISATKTNRLMLFGEQSLFIVGTYGKHKYI